MKRISILIPSVAILVASAIAAFAQTQPVPPPQAPGSVPSGRTAGERNRPPTGFGAPGMHGPGIMGQPGFPFGGPQQGMMATETAHQAIVMEILREVLPVEAEHLERLRATEPEVFFREIHELTPEAMELREMREHDPRRYEQMVKIHRFEHEAHRIAERARELEGTSRAGTLDELDNRLEQIFDFKQQLREKEVEHLEAELERLRRGLNQRQEHRDEIIARRRAELLGEIEPLEW